MVRESGGPSGRKSRKPRAKARSQQDGGAPVPGPDAGGGAANESPLRGELSIIDRQTLGRLGTAAERLSRSNDSWLAAAGGYVGAAVSMMSAPQGAAAAQFPPVRSMPAGDIWRSLARFLSANPAGGLADARAAVHACVLYWTQVPENLIELHDYHAAWDAAGRKLLARALGRLNSVWEMCEHLAGFEDGATVPSFGVTAGVLLQGVRQHEEIRARRGAGGEELRTLIAGGDFFLCRDLPGRIIERGAQSVLSDLEPLLAAGDIALANLEAVISSTGSFARKGERRPFYLHCPPQFVDVLSECGISCVTTANNHSGDFGPEALAEQIGLLAGAGIASAGSGRNAEAAERPVYLDAEGITVAVIAFETETPRFAAGENSPGVFHVPIDGQAVERLTPLIAEALWNADIVVASPHWGPNWQTAPGRKVRDLAHAIIDLGVHAVIGHSAHVLQGVEVYNGCPIVYDMGCLVVDRAAEPALRRSGLFELRFDRTGVRQLVFHPLAVSSGKTQLARGDEARTICDHIVGLSAAIDAGLRWRHEEDALQIDLEPGTASPEPDALKRGTPAQVHRRSSIRLIAGTEPSGNAFHMPAALPPGLGEIAGADMGGGLVVLGQRRAQRARTGYGFLVEVLFSCPDPRGRHWRASLRADPVAGDGVKFQYRHPVSEGMWQSQIWDRDDLLRDAFVVLPPKTVRPGRYQLSWALVDVVSGRIWPAGKGRSPVGWVRLGVIDVGDDAPPGVAGVDWDTDLAWTPLTGSDRSR